jgi:hypothetical protein
MLVNESVSETVRGTLTVPRCGEAIAFDAFSRTLTQVPSENGPDLTIVQVELAPGSALVLVVGTRSAWDGVAVLAAGGCGHAEKLQSTWSISTASALEYPAFADWNELDELRPLNDLDLLPRFSGTARYTTEFDFDVVGDRHVLDLGEVFELASVRLNGVDLGTRIAPPYEFGVPDGLLAERNTIEIDVTNTLAKAQPDFFSAFAQQQPSGLVGPVTIAPLVTQVPA